MPPLRSAVRRGLLAACALAVCGAAAQASANDVLSVRAVTGLPRASLADGQPVAWRNVGVVAESDLLDVALDLPSCLPATGAPATPADRRSAACAGGVEEPGNAIRGHRLALTLKVPRWSDGAPVVDLTLRNWQAAPQDGAGNEGQRGSAAEASVTQSWGSVEAFAGGSMPLAAGGSRWRSVYAGVGWFPVRGTRIEFVADRGAEAGSSTIDRTLTLRLVHAARRGARLAAWATRALDDRADSWQLGAGVDVRF